MKNNMESAVVKNQNTTSEEESQKVASLFFRPVDGCVKTYFRSSSLSQHIETEDHKIRPDGKSLYDKVKQGYARRLQELVLKTDPSLKNPNDTQPGQHKLAQGWALKSNKSISSFNKKQKDFVNRI